MKRSPLKRNTPLRRKRPTARKTRPISIVITDAAPLEKQLRESPALRKAYEKAMESGLKRSTPLGRSWIKRKRPRVRDDADPKYRAWLRRQPCAVPGCIARRCHAHHHSLMESGTSKKCADRFSFSLCVRHHVPGLHSLAGFFKGWTREQLKAWQDEMCARYRAAYERVIGAAA